MITLRRRFLVRALAIFDVGLMAVCFFTATLLTSAEINQVTLHEFLAMRVAIGNLVLLAILVLLWNRTLNSFHLYKSRRLPERRQEFMDLLAAVSLGTLGIAVASFLFNIEIVTTHFIVLFWALAFIAIATSRILLRLSLHRVRLAGRNLRRVAIVGTNERAIEVAKLIQNDPRLGYDLVGFVDDEWDGSNQVKQNGYEVVSSLADFADFLRTEVIDEVFICMPVKSFYDQTSTVMKLCEQQGIIVRFRQNVFSIQSERVSVENWEDQVWITVEGGNIRGGALLVKRMIDVILSSLVLIILSPLLIIVAILIKLDSPGPVFFVQERVGLGKRRFNVYKFRTMSVDAEAEQESLKVLNEADGPVFKIKNDPRVTKLGRFLRRTSIDELPQFVNVLRGDMTVVGPRPLPVQDYNGFSEDWHRRRFSVRPGITCLWQVEGRSSIPFERWMELDLEYIDRWSLWLDFKILLKTVRAVLRGSGAY